MSLVRLRLTHGMLAGCSSTRPLAAILLLMLAAGIFVGQRNAGDDTGNANPEARKTAHSAPTGI